MVGTMKGIHNIHMQSNNSRRRWNNDNKVYIFSLLLLLLFVAAILGVMGLQRIKETRACNRVIQEKDSKISSIHILLQKERDHTQELKRKMDEMKVKIYNLRTHKSELNSKILEMQSIISSLKEEQKTIELSFQEKQSEKNSQLTALSESIRQKEDEINDLKHTIELHANFTAKQNLPEGETMINQSPNKKESSEQVEGNPTNDVSKYGDAESDGRLIEGKKSAQGQFKLDNIQEKGVENGTSDNDEMKGDSLNNGDQKVRGEDGDTNLVDTKEPETDGSNTRGSDSQESGTVEGGVKLEIQGSPPKYGNRLRGKHGRLRRSKGKGWRSIDKETEGKANKPEDVNPISQEKVEDSSNESRMQFDDKLPDRGREDLNSNSKGYIGENSEDSPPGISKNNVEHTDTEDLTGKAAKVEKLETSQQLEKGSEVTDTNSSSVSNNATMDVVQPLQEREGVILRQHIEKKNDDSNEGTKVAEKYEDQNDEKIEDIEEETDWGV